MFERCRTTSFLPLLFSIISSLFSCSLLQFLLLFGTDFWPFSRVLSCSLSRWTLLIIIRRLLSRVLSLSTSLLSTFVGMFNEYTNWLCILGGNLNKPISKLKCREGFAGGIKVSHYVDYPNTLAFLPRSMPWKVLVIFFMQMITPFNDRKNWTCSFWSFFCM